jgi:hypothetical protein
MTLEQLTAEQIVALCIGVPVGIGAIKLGYAYFGPLYDITVLMVKAVRGDITYEEMIETKDSSPRFKAYRKWALFEE